MLVLENIKKFYKIGPIKIEVLKDISLEIQDKELVSIIGASGCGKSTLMHIMGLLDQPTSGTYFLDGEDVFKLDDNQLSVLRNKKIGFVFQAFYLLPRLTAIENVALPLTYRDGIKKKDIEELCWYYLKRVKMDNRAYHKPNELSGGQQQRIAIARALVTEPSVLFADEPTGALDSKVGQEIMDLFIELNEERGITTVIITHDMNIAKQCRRIIYMADGILREEI